MIVEPAPHLHRQVLDLIKDEYKLAEWREGTHNSTLCYCLTRAYWDKTDPLTPSDDEVLLWSLGFGLERVFLPQIHATPFQWNDIWFSPDIAIDRSFGDLKMTRMAVDSSAGCALCGEPYKGHTKAKSGHNYEKAPPVPFVFPEGWVRQFKGYVYAGTQLEMVRRSDPFEVAVVHIIKPALATWSLRFTEGELETHAGWLADRHSALDSMLAADDPQPFQHNMDYECANCRYSLRCQLEASLRGEKNG